MDAVNLLQQNLKQLAKLKAVRRKVEMTLAIWCNSESGQSSNKKHNNDSGNNSNIKNCDNKCQ